MTALIIIVQMVAACVACSAFGWARGNEHEADDTLRRWHVYVGFVCWAIFGLIAVGKWLL